MIVVPGFGNIAVGEWRLALRGDRRRTATAVGCLALALSGVALFQALQTPAVAGSGRGAPGVEAPFAGTPAEVPPESRRALVGRPGDAAAAGMEMAGMETDTVTAGDRAGAVDGADHRFGDRPVAGPIEKGIADEAVTGGAVAAAVEAGRPVGPLALKAVAKAQDLRTILARAVAVRREIQCLALNIYFEARSEADAGKRAVAHVVMNRVTDPRFPESVCAVVRQGGEWPLHRCQFSWWCDGKSDRPRDLAAWARSKALARQIYWGVSADPTRGALWYHADYVAPAWGQVLRRAAKIGRHIFYQDPRAPGVQLASAYE